MKPSSITGFNRIEESDMIAMPDPSRSDYRIQVTPWELETYLSVT